MNFRRIFFAAMFLVIGGGSAQAQMATVYSNGIRGTCLPGCVLNVIETDVQIARHANLNPETEIKVELQQLLTGPVTIQNVDGSTSIVQQTYSKVIGESEWTLEVVNATTIPTSLKISGTALPNPNGDRRTGTFRLVGKMRTLSGVDGNGNNQYTNPIVFATGNSTTLECNGCGGIFGGVGIFGTGGG